MKKVLFIDRDGTVIVEPPDEQVDSLEKLVFFPGAIFNLVRIARETDFELVMVTNQDGLGTVSFPEGTFWPAHNKMIKTLENEGVRFADVLIDRSFPEDNAPTRKPGTGLLTRYLNGDYDLSNSYVVGDRETDIQLAHNIGAGAIYISPKPHPRACLATTDWEEIYRFLKRNSRKSRLARRTTETGIEVEINLDGSGEADIKTGLGFFDHMLEQLVHHSGVDLFLRAEGDLRVDEHHTIEDTALALGAAWKAALGKKTGIERYGFLLPMDESRAEVALDFSGRSWLVWQAEFRRERIGEMPTEMFRHFFKSFSDAAGCTLHILAEGENEHHKIEAIFKAVGRAIRQAIRKTGDAAEIPSTKGVL